MASMWKEDEMAYLKVVSQNLLIGNEENLEKCLVRRAGLRAKNQTRNSQIQRQNTIHSTTTFGVLYANISVTILHYISIALNFSVCGVKHDVNKNLSLRL